MAQNSDLAPRLREIKQLLYCFIPGGYSTNVYMHGEAPPKVQPLTLLYTIFREKRYSLGIPSSVQEWQFTCLSNVIEC